MTYYDTVNWMFSKLPMYQNKGKLALKKDLNNTDALSRHLDEPHKNFKSIHVGGTNGKGSTSHMLASILQEAGYKVGLYTSPHLKDFRERIKINGKTVSKKFVIDFIRHNKQFLNSHHLSFFEMSVGMAFDYFSKQNVDIGIIEVGLGGRLDSTNIITPEVSVITNIGLDHIQFLGETLEKIAIEKAGIIKQNIPVIIGQTQIETAPIFKQIAMENECTIYFADILDYNQYESDLKGLYQIHNIKTVLCTINHLKKKGYLIYEKNIVDGLNKVVSNTGLFGRWQIIQKQPKIIADTAHNSDGIRYTMKQIKNEAYNKLHILLGVVDDKNLNTIIDLFPMEADYYFCKPNVQRGLDATILRDFFSLKNRKGNVYNSVKEAIQSAKKNASKNDLIYIGGSTFVVAEII